LGPDDEYYLALNDGKAFWSGPDEMMRDIRGVRNQGPSPSRVTGVVFGDATPIFFDTRSNCAYCHHVALFETSEAAECDRKI